MILSVSKIKQNPGLSLNFEVSGKVPAEVAAEFPEFSVEQPVEFSGTVTNEGKVAFRVTGSYKAQVGYSCGRCLKECTKQVSGDIEALFCEDISGIDQDEIDVRCMDGDKLPLADLIMSDIAFEFPMQPLCREDCKGICPVCGADLNNEACSCNVENIDPRWEKLKNFKFTPDK